MPPGAWARRGRGHRRASMRHATPTGTSRRSMTTSSRLVHLRDPHVDHLVARRGHVLAHVVGPDGQLAMAAVDEHRQSDRRGPTLVHERIHGGPDGPPGVQHVIDDDDGRRGAGRTAGSCP